MEWIAAAIVYVFLMYRWPKWTLIVVGSVAGVAALGIGLVQLVNYLDDLDEAKVAVTCGFPQEGGKFFYTVKNDSSKTLHRVEFTISVRKKGHSSVLETKSVTSDKILAPSETYTDDRPLLLMKKIGVVSDLDQSLNDLLNLENVPPWDKYKILQAYGNWLCMKTDVLTEVDPDDDFEKLINTKFSDFKCLKFYNPKQVDISVNVANGKFE